MGLPLHGRNALITGVSRRRGIGYAVARRFAADGANVFIQHYRAHDTQHPWGGDDIAEVSAGIRAAQVDGALFGEIDADLSQPTSAPDVIAAATATLGRLDILICNHALTGSDGSIFEITAENLDAHWAVNARSTLLLTRYFAEQFAPQEATSTQPGVHQMREPQDEFRAGRVIWMTSGQVMAPMPAEVAYAASKAALAGLTPTVASELLSRGIILNTVNPGPVNTGYLDPETADRPLGDVETFLQSLPFGRVGAPEDPARLIAWLASDEGRWLVGQVLSTEGGFRL